MLELLKKNSHNHPNKFHSRSLNDLTSSTATRIAFDRGTYNPSPLLAILAQQLDSTFSFETLQMAMALIF
jgi:hypothetical protein